MWETQKIRVIKAGTLEKLVESLVTFKGELDSTYVNVFLATYRTFATPKQVLELLVKRCSSTRCRFCPIVVQHLVLCQLQSHYLYMSTFFHFRNNLQEVSCKSKSVVFIYLSCTHVIYRIKSFGLIL